MTCREVQEQLSAFLDGEVPEDLRNRIAMHLKGCPLCQREYLAMERLTAALQELVVPPPRDLAPRVRSCLLRRAGAWWRNLALAACLVMGLVVGGTLTSRLYGESIAFGSQENNGVALEILKDYPSGSLAGVLTYQGEEENGT